MQNLKSIVAGIDFTPGSTASLREAIRLVQWNRSPVHAVQVMDILVAMEVQEAHSAFQKDNCEGLVADARRAWEMRDLDVEGARRDSTCSVPAVKPQGCDHPLATGEDQPPTQDSGRCSDQERV